MLSGEQHRRAWCVSVVVSTSWPQGVVTLAAYALRESRIASRHVAAATDIACACAGLCNTCRPRQVRESKYDRVVLSRRGRGGETGRRQWMSKVWGQHWAQ
eukprot:376643-Prymnesium_polylepis.2